MVLPRPLPFGLHHSANDPGTAETGTELLAIQTIGTEQIRP